MMKNLHKKYLSAFAASIISFSAVLAQESSMQVLKLEDMSFFEEQEGNWFIVGDVTMNPAIDIHEGSTRAVKYTPGEGVLLNMNSDDKNSQLVTELKHGDIDLIMDVMLPEGSNSGILPAGPLRAPNI